MRAIEPAVVKVPRPPGDATRAIVTIAAIITNAATTRQNVSLRRILRRSTMTSESSDIENSPESWFLNGGRVLFRGIPLISRGLNTSIAAQYEGQTARVWTARPKTMRREKGPG